MDFLTILFLAVAVAADCFVVSVSNGMACKRFCLKSILKMAFMFGLFQALMPTISWLLGRSCGSLIEPIDHWIALVILSFLGIKMIIESRKEEDEEQNAEVVMRWGRLFVLAIATSIDALAIGLVFLTESVERFTFAVFCIGICSFFFSFLGNYLGIKIGNRLPFNTELIAGIILILIGLKVFVEHMFF